MLVGCAHWEKQDGLAPTAQASIAAVWQSRLMRLFTCGYGYGYEYWRIGITGEGIGMVEGVAALVHRCLSNHNGIVRW